LGLYRGGKGEGGEGGKKKTFIKKEVIRKGHEEGARLEGFGKGQREASAAKKLALKGSGRVTWSTFQRARSIPSESRMRKKGKTD